MLSSFLSPNLQEEAEREIPQGLLFYNKSRMVARPSICQKLMADAHGTSHVGITKTYNNVRTLFWWPSMFSDVKRMVDCCQACLMSHKTNLRDLAYHPLETAHQPRELAYLDILGPVTGIKSEYHYVLMILDGYSNC